MTNAKALAAIVTNLGGTPAPEDTIADLIAKIATLVSPIGDDYELPVATADTLGGIKLGDGLKMTNGVLSLDLPAATDSTLGGIIVGTGLTVSDGVLSVTG